MWAAIRLGAFFRLVDSLSMAAARPTIFSIGHSTRTSDDLTAILAEASVTILVDVRRFPSSRRHPQFNRGPLASALRNAGLRYEWLGEELGGRRRETRPAEQSPNAAWKVAAFRHYADAMDTPEFLSGIDRLEQLGRSQPTGFMCAEHNWWSCHRRLIADFLVVRGWRVVHLLDAGKSKEHELTEFARVSDGRLTYPSLV
jgi:uncharacterized protein (DUF488 family)